MPENTKAGFSLLLHSLELLCMGEVRVAAPKVASTIPCLD